MASMETCSVLLIASLMIGAALAENFEQGSTLQFLSRRIKRQQGTLQQQLQNTQQQQQQQNQFGQNSQNQQQQQQQQQNQFGQNSQNFWQGNNGNSQTQSQNTNQGSTTTNDAETQRINNCIQQNCRQGIQLASVCGTDNVSYKNRPYFNCARDCGRRIEIQHVGDCFTTRGPPTALSTG